MTVVRSAGLLLFRDRGRDGGTAGAADAVGTEVLLGHMGGPYWQGRQERAWSVPKGEYTPDEEPMAAARREFEEELGLAPPAGEWLPLGEARQRNGKIVTVWAVAGDLDTSRVVPGTFTMEWPPHSGRTEEFPEIDRAEWCGLAQARIRLVAGQLVFLDRLTERLARRTS
ncbi:NUDIX domain-containing protein [Streptomyces yaizuensis]|uniref:NUDIX domain-containing protein n=1 Tax=Streptomyces yaizuensis TaxID=2989713 RepID=A0ABQ5P6W4_9ACTN|nr:NUDIX domain-containing protein [Streptomyces sp. YSPA8]GLF98321.1 NUDIX domain-containing protein [Streptomyces sp. YSPA8]